MKKKTLFPETLYVVCRPGYEKTYFYASIEVDELNAYEGELVAFYELGNIGKKRTKIEWE